MVGELCSKIKFKNGTKMEFKLGTKLSFLKFYENLMFETF